MKSFFFAPILAFALVTAPAWAQSAPAAVATKNPCSKPGEYPGKLASDNQRRSWQKSMDEYGDCVKKFSADQRAIVDAAMKAGNDAVEEYNGIVTRAKASIERDKE